MEKTKYEIDNAMAGFLYSAIGGYIVKEDVQDKDKLLELKPSKDIETIISTLGF